MINDSLDERRPIVFIAMILLSLLLHALAAGGYWEWSRRQGWDLSAPPPALQTRVISTGEFARLESRETVHSAPRKLVKNPKDRAQYVSERTQRVEKQTIAEGSHDGQEGARGGRPGRPNAGRGAESVEESAEKLRKLGLGAGIAPSASHSGGEDREGYGGDGRVSHGQDFLRNKDIAMGTRTLLNTDEYVYASFFNRFRDDVAARWEPRVNAILQQPQRQIRPGEYHTQTRFWFNDAGQILRIEIEKSSGVAAFDEAAREALRELPEIRNPPRALKGRDGTYEMQFGFIVYYGESGFRANYVPDPRL